MYLFSIIVLIFLLISLGLFLFAIYKLLWYMIKIPQKKKRLNQISAGEFIWVSEMSYSKENFSRKPAEVYCML